MKYFLSFLFILVVLLSCQNDKKVKSISVNPLPIVPEVVYEFGYNINNYNVIKDTIRRNETLGIILDRHHVDYPTIHSIVQSVKDSFDLKK